jgi:hypothetical protein
MLKSQPLADDRASFERAAPDPYRLQAICPAPANPRRLPMQSWMVKTIDRKMKM